MINYHQCINNLSAYIDGEMQENEAKAVEKHLRECSSCSKEFELLKAIISISNELNEDLPDGFGASLNKRLEAAKVDTRNNKFNVINLRLISQIAAAFIIVVTLGLFVRLGLPGNYKSGSNTADMADEYTESGNTETFAMSMAARGADNGKMAQNKVEETIIASFEEVPKEQKEDEDTGIKLTMGGINGYQAAEFTSRSLKREDNLDTQVTIEVDDINKAIDSILVIEENLKNSDKDNERNIKQFQDICEDNEEPVNMELYYEDDETWYKFLNELQVIYPDMVVESLPAEDGNENIHIILVKKR